MTDRALIHGRAARIVLCDDSTFARVALTKILTSAGAEIVRACRNGAEAVVAAAELKPDLIIMDIEMPVLDGLEATRRIMAESPTRVVILSGVAREGRIQSMKAMRAGAIDVLAKPEAARITEIRDQLLAMIANALEATVVPVSLHSMADARVVSHDTGTSSPSARMDGAQTRQRDAGPRTADTSANTNHLRTLELKRKLDVDIVAIGASTGGPSALTRVLAGLPANFRLPILIVQHMPAGWTETLAEQLAGGCALTVREAASGEIVKPGTVYIAPGNRHLELAPARQLLLHDGPLDGGFRPAVNTLFRSVARLSRGRCLGIVLTGMGHDGTEGADAIRKAGGFVVAQDRESSVLYGMPRAVAEAGFASLVLPLGEIGEYLIRQGT